jgi:hypothetical protein
VASFSLETCCLDVAKREILRNEKRKKERDTERKKKENREMN